MVVLIADKRGGQGESEDNMAVSDLEGRVQTVLGTIDGDALGLTSCHEHLLWDFTGYYKEPEDEADRRRAHEPVSLENLHWIRVQPGANKDNLRQTDEALAIRELTPFKQAGGGTVVELSNRGMARDPSGLARISEATGLHIVMGSGYYVADSHPPDMDTKTEQDIADEIVKDLLEGVDDTGIRAGIIGEIGCSAPFTENERKVMRGCAMAQRQTGAPLNVHPSVDDDLVLENIKELRESGADLTHVAISHIDGFNFRADTVRKILDAGCYVEYDGFGQAVYHIPYAGKVLNRLSDLGRLEAIAELIRDGYRDRVLIGQDYCFKCVLASYGGYGYHHLLVNLPPVMKAVGLIEDDIKALLVDNPRTFLAFAPAAG